MTADYFESNCGVRQGENLSPVLFAIYLNDLEDYLNSKNHNGFVLDNQENDIYSYLKLLILLYADDTILLSDDTVDLQNSLNDFIAYCKEWKLNINIDKTKCIAFCSRNRRIDTIKIGNHPLEWIDSYKYLGTMFSKSGSFINMRKHLTSQANKAMHLLYKRINNLQLPFDLCLKLFDNTILPILLYAVEIWGFEDINMLERIHCSILRYIFKLKKSTPLYMLYAATGRFPLIITIKARMINFWYKMVTGNHEKICFKIYRLMLGYQNFSSKWINFVKSVLNDSGRYDIWLNQNNLPGNITPLIKQNLKDQYTQNWHTSLNNSPKGRTYSIFKNELTSEKYLTDLRPYHAINLIKFRTGNHYFPIETGRWNNLDLPDRSCRFCFLTGEIADEFHYLFKCPYFDELRKRHIKQYYYKRPNIHKFQQLMTSSCKIDITNLSKFAGILIQTVKH